MRQRIDDLNVGSLDVVLSEPNIVSLTAGASTKITYVKAFAMRRQVRSSFCLVPFAMSSYAFVPPHVYAIVSPPCAPVDTIAPKQCNLCVRNLALAYEPARSARRADAGM